MNTNNYLTTFKNNIRQSDIVFVFKPVNHEKIITNNTNEAAENISIINNKDKTVCNGVIKIDLDGEKEFEVTEKDLEELINLKREIDVRRKLHLPTETSRRRISRRNIEKNTSQTKKTLFINDNKLVRYHEIYNSKKQPFLYDIKLEISFDGEQLEYMTAVIKSTLDIIMGAIIHRHHPWRIATRAIIMDLLMQVTDAYINERCPSYRWKTALHARGYCPGNKEQENINEPLPSVHKSLAYTGYLKPKKSNYVSNPENYSLMFKYAMNYFLSPIVKKAQSSNKTKCFKLNTWMPSKGRKFAFENFNFIANSTNYDYNKMYTDALRLVFIDEQKRF
ncbi:hypothetical protein PV328_007939 [Microctonus aethiopoides]|uniref:Uncharacterized protein n=1 Tax=Microctonus aethiopoides TaxID=144406 RepID=A0AA39C9X4_9HYME|nr:hypothetical protein PV328_007939 [Microctonus aethiopoides]